MLEGRVSNALNVNYFTGHERGLAIPRDTTSSGSESVPTHPSASFVVFELQCHG